VLSAWTIYQTRNYDLALVKARELLTLNPDFMQSHLQLANILCEAGDPEEALLHARKATEMEPHSPLPPYALCFALAKAGQHSEAEAVTHDLAKLAETTYVAPYFLGLCNVAIGNKERAVELLDAARLEQSGWILWLATEPKLDSLRNFPPFIELIAKTGLPA
jgi:Flp pilus assembly protein TadD